MAIASAPRTAPTEAEIRADLAEHATYPAGDPLPTQLRAVIVEWSNAIACSAFDVLGEEPAVTPGALWTDLRRSEASGLQMVVDKAIARAASRCEAIIVDELVAAGLEFAEAFPHAPRRAG